MKQEDRDLYLKDLCARLPYHPKAEITFGKIKEIKTFDSKHLFGPPYTSRKPKTYEVKLFLRPLSSMTEEERKELEKITYHTFEYKKGARDIWTKSYHRCHLFNGAGKLYGAGEPINMLCSSELCTKLIDWLNMHHFDYRHLIEKGLALEASEGMYK